MERMSDVEREELWDRWEAGESQRSISRRLGRSPTTVRTLLVSAGWNRPNPGGEWSSLRLSLVEREEISRGLSRDESLRSIAHRLGRSPSTVSREVKTNGGRGSYRATVAHRASRRRAKRPKVMKLEECSPLRNAVEIKLLLWWSPSQISRWLVRAYPSDEAMWVSHETIYRSLFVQGSADSGPSVGSESEVLMAYTVEPGTVLKFATETFEFLATPTETGDRYRVRLTATPGGGPGVKGFGPHIHDGSTEIFNCVSGVMTYRLGREIATLAPGETVEVPPGSVRGFKNPGQEPLVIEVDVVLCAVTTRHGRSLSVYGLWSEGDMQSAPYGGGNPGEICVDLQGNGKR